MKIKKDRAIKWTSTDNAGNSMIYIGILKNTSNDVYKIDIPGLGQLDVQRDDGLFEAVPMSEYHAEVEREAAEAEAVEAEAAAAAEAAEKSQKSKSQKSKTQKTFCVAGYSKRPDGVYRLRFANDMCSRVKILSYNGHTDIQLVEVDEGLKTDCVRQLAEHEKFQQDDIAQQLIAEWMSVNDLKMLDTSAWMRYPTLSLSNNEITA